MTERIKTADFKNLEQTVRKPLPKGWWGWNANGEPIEKCPYGFNGMDGDYGL